MEEITKSDPPKKIDDPLSRIISSSSTDGVVVKTRCKICNSVNRKTIESMFTNGQSLFALKEFMDKNGEPVTIGAVQSHINNHYKTQEQLTFLSEYRDHVAGMVEKRRAMIDDIEWSINVGWYEFGRILAIQCDGSLAKEKERNDMLLKTMKSIREGMELLAKMDAEETRVRAVYQKLIQVWQIKIESAKTPEEKQLCMSTLLDFKKIYQDMSTG